MPVFYRWIDTRWCKVAFLILYSAFGTIVAQTPYLASNLAVGSGVKHIAMHCIAHVLLHSCTSILSLIYIFTVRNILFYEHSDIRCWGLIYSSEEWTNITSGLHWWHVLPPNTFVLVMYHRGVDVQRLSFIPYAVRNKCNISIYIV